MRRKLTEEIIAISQKQGKIVAQKYYELTYDIKRIKVYDICRLFMLLFGMFL